MTGQGSNGIANNFDQQAITAAFTITAAFIQQSGIILASKAQQADAAKTTLQSAAGDNTALTDALKANNPQVVQDLINAPGTLTPTQQQAAQNYVDTSNWAPGGTYNQIATGLNAALSGNVTGGTGQLAQAGLGILVQSLGAQGIKQIADSYATPNADQNGVTDNVQSGAIRALLQGIAGCAGAAIGGGNCGAGAAGASASVVINNALDVLTGTNPETMTAEEKQNRLNLIGSLVAGTATATGNANAAVVVVAMGTASVEMDNNHWLHNCVFSILCSRSIFPCFATSARSRCYLERKLRMGILVSLFTTEKSLLL